jgi:dTDP-glucose 4,6-dehydratase
MKFLITGGCGFIGSNFIRYLFKKYKKDVFIVNLDKLTYAGNPDNLKEFENFKNYKFIKGDICNKKDVKKAMEGVEIVVNFAAETHVDRSILGPDSFLKTDIFGVYVLLEEAIKRKIKLFLQISTDEVYGEILNGSFKETSPLNPRSPYSASKAGGDRLAFSYFHTYGVPVIITRASNNFGPFQYPEKLIPLFVTNALEDLPLPVYGDGLQVRDWLYVEDHCKALDLLIEKGKIGEVYNIGGGNEKKNIEITKLILKNLKKPESLIKYVEDRPAHDRRYSLNFDKIKKLGYKPSENFEELLDKTIEWYVKNKEWWQKIKSGRFKKYYIKQYGKRL